MTATGDQYELCMRQENVYLPKNGYFGISAATGGLAGENLMLFNFLSDNKNCDLVRDDIKSFGKISIFS